MKNSNAQALATLLVCSLGATSAFGVEHGTLTVIQLNTTNNNQSSSSPAVSVTIDPGATGNFMIRGHNKGDFELAFTDDPANDRLLGILLSSVAQNGRNNGAPPHSGGPAGIQYGTSHSEPAAAGFYIPAQATLAGPQGSNSELNINVAGAWFPHEEGWLAAHFKTPGTLYTSPAIRFGQEFVNHGDGTSRVDLRHLRSHGVPATSQNGVLLAVGGDNNVGSIALTQANDDGTFTISLKYSSDAFVTTYRDGGAAFVYVPVAAAGSGQVKALGKIQSDGGTILGGGDFTVTKIGTGEWLLQIDGIIREDGTLIIAPEGGIPPEGADPLPKNVNNFVSYEWSAERDGWIVQSRDLSTLLEDGATPDEPMFSFVFLTPGEGLSYENPPLPAISLTSPEPEGVATVGQPFTLTADVEVPDGVEIEKVEFYVDGELAGTATAPPYEVQWLVDRPGYWLVEAFAYTTGGAVAGANRVKFYGQNPAPTIPGYSVAILDGGDPETDVTELDPEYVPSETTPWLAPANTPEPLAFDSFGEVRGAPAVSINGQPVPFNSGILLGTNYTGDNYADPTTRGSIDNNVIAYERDGYYALKVEDNKQGGGNPIVRPESGRFALGFFPFANGWAGASVATDASIVADSSNLPEGVTITRSGTADYLIEGLPMTGNLIAVSYGEHSDNVASVGRSGNRWVVRSVDNDGNQELDSISFLYVPADTPQVFSGLIVADGTLTPLNENLAAVGAQVAQTGNGYEIQFGDGSAINPSNTVLFVAPDFNSGNGADNIYSYYAMGNKFVVFSHDLPGIGGGFQTGGFRFLAVPVEPLAEEGTQVFVSTPVDLADEGDELVFRFARLGGDLSQPLTIHYTVGGTATPGTDYEELPGTATFAGGETVLDVPARTLADKELEEDENVILTLSESEEYVARGGTVVGWIRNALYLPTVQSASFQQGVNGYFGQFGKRVGDDGTHQSDSAVQSYYVDGLNTPTNPSPDINGIIRFDNIFGNGEGQIPVGAQIVKAELVLTTANGADSRSPGPWVVDRLLHPVDATTTYIQMTVGSFVGVRGISSRTPVAGFGNLTNNSVNAADVTQFVRVWAEAAEPNAANHGFSIYDATTSDGWEYCTSGNNDPNKRPKLVVSYVAGKQAKSYTYAPGRSARLVGTAGPTVDGSTLMMAFIDQETGATQEGLFHFPVEFGDAVGAIPDDEEIVKAELILNTSSPAYSFDGGSPDARSVGPVAVHRMLVDWTVESDFGFNGPVVGSEIAIAEKTRISGLGNLSVAAFDVTSIVHAWRDGQENFGINVKPETTDGWQFFWPGAGQGIEANYEAKRPKLVIHTAKATGEPGDSAFDLWAIANGIPGASHDSDTDRDGIPALIEYALGLNPRAFDRLPGLERVDDNVTLRFAKDSDDDRLQYVIQSSINLQSWADETAMVDDADEISLTVPVGEAGSRFFRLSVSYRE